MVRQTGFGPFFDNVVNDVAFNRSFGVNQVDAGDFGEAKGGADAIPNQCRRRLFGRVDQIDDVLRQLLVVLYGQGEVAVAAARLNVETADLQGDDRILRQWGDVAGGAPNFVAAGRALVAHRAELLDPNPPRRAYLSNVEKPKDGRDVRLVQLEPFALVVVTFWVHRPFDPCLFCEFGILLGANLFEPQVLQPMECGHVVELEKHEAVLFPLVETVKFCPGDHPTFDQRVIIKPTELLLQMVDEIFALGHSERLRDLDVEARFEPVDSDRVGVAIFIDPEKLDRKEVGALRRFFVFLQLLSDMRGAAIDNPELHAVEKWLLCWMAFKKCKKKRIQRLF